MKAGAMRATTILGAALLAACAPDAWRASPAYDAFLTQVEKACYFQRIGQAYVGELITNPGAMQAAYFIDETSRLYFGKITPENWTSGVTAFLGGRAGDPGVRCVLDQLRQNRAAQGTAAQ